MKKKTTKKTTKCAMCGKKLDADGRERVANGDAQLCQPCYRIEYHLDQEQNFCYECGCGIGDDFGLCADCE